MCLQIIISNVTNVKQRTLITLTLYRRYAKLLVTEARELSNYCFVKARVFHQFFSNDELWFSLLMINIDYVVLERILKVLTLFIFPRQATL